MLDNLNLKPEPGQSADDFMEALDASMEEEDMTREEWDTLYQTLINEEQTTHLEEQKVDEAQRKAERIAQLSPPPEPETKDTGCTKLGTPCSPKWDEEWIAQVDKTEEETGHQCCGAKVNGICPCELEPAHKNGRCRFHGGAPGSGAQKGNTNARIHGLYSRRLQTCGQHCQHRDTCPYTGDDLKDLPQSKRPVCPLEQQEMDELRKLDAASHEPFVPLEERPLEELEQAPYPMHTPLVTLRENLNMLQVMITRASNALITEQFTVQTVSQTDKHFNTNEKPSAALQALQILTREYRLMTNTYMNLVKQWGLPKYQSPN